MNVETIITFIILCLSFLGGAYFGFKAGFRSAALTLKEFLDIFTIKVRARIGDEDYNAIYSQSIENFEKQLKERKK